ncbi:MAG: response regulator [Deltaproteobacteria bacterium]|nr:response regulator [Deltaproteobacteria bacterium]
MENKTIEKILVVDDELGMREGCRKILVLEGFQVVTAEDGQAGLEAFEKHRDFSAALIDLKMPRKSGLELIEAIRAQDKRILLLVVTAYATIKTAVKAIQQGADGYIPKPFTPDELLLPLRSGLEKRALALETERLKREREERLLEVAFERSKANTIIDCMTDAVMVVNRDRQIVLQNAAAVRLMPEPACQPPSPLSTLGCQELCELLQAALDCGSERSISSQETRLGGCTYMVNASPVQTTAGKTLGAVAVLRDISSLKKLSESKSMFVSMVAHEIKSPLAAIEGYLEILRSGTAGQDPDRIRSILGRCQLRARTLREMVSELMNLVAMETGHFTLKRSPTELTELVSEVVDGFQDRARSKGIELSLHCDDGRDKKVLADRDAVRCIFTNLIDNAIKYTHSGGHVDVRLSRNDVYMRVSVKDDGFGMKDEDRQRIFEEFFRIKSDATAEIPGTGLGLCVVKRLVDMHQGKVSVKSALGDGSEFVVSLRQDED